MVNGLVEPLELLKWGVIAYALYQGMRFLMVVRLYLVNGYRDPSLRPITPRQLDPGMLELLSSLDDSLGAAGFRHLGFAQGTILLSSYDKPVPCGVFVNEKLPAFAFVRPSNAPQYSAPAELQLQTYLESGNSVVTFNMPVAAVFTPPDWRVGGLADATVATLVETHRIRVASECRQTAPSQHTGLDEALERERASSTRLRESLRTRGWMSTTSDPCLYRFTLLGALGLAYDSRRAIGGRLKGATPVRPGPTATDRRLRVEADMRAVLAAAENPEPIPGTPWPLLIVAAITAVVSWVAAGLLFDFYYATLVLAILALHEGGHALAMRLLGYRDVHIFFVPLLGALTLGRPATSSIRDRILVFLAGPIPGLWLGLLLAVVGRMYDQPFLLRAAPLLLLLLNGANLLPFTPLDGGRVLEILTRPESVARIVVHVVSGLAILAAGLYFRDPIVIGLSAALLAMLPQQWRTWQLRRAVAALAPDKSNFGAVARTTLEIISAEARYASWRPAVRVATARAFGRSFAEPEATTDDRLWGTIAYVSAWIPVGAWLVLRAS